MTQTRMHAHTHTHTHTHTPTHKNVEIDTCTHTHTSETEDDGAIKPRYRQRETDVQREGGWVGRWVGGGYCHEQAEQAHFVSLNH